MNILLIVLGLILIACCIWGIKTYYPFSENTFSENLYVVCLAITALASIIVCIKYILSIC